jgi:hypothetical protein
MKISTRFCLIALLFMSVSGCMDEGQQREDRAMKARIHQRVQECSDRAERAHPLDVQEQNREANRCIDQLEYR